MTLKRALNNKIWRKTTKQNILNTASCEDNNSIIKKEEPLSDPA